MDNSRHCSTVKVVRPNNGAGGIDCDLTQTRYPQPDRILSVAPNSLLAASSSRVYRVSDGTPLATVPGPCPVQTFSRDSGTLYCADAGFLTSLDVRALK